MLAKQTLIKKWNAGTRTGGIIWQAVFDTLGAKRGIRTEMESIENRHPTKQAQLEY